MLTELGLFAMGIGTYQILKNGEQTALKNKVRNTWLQNMNATGVQNKLNQTYDITKVIPKKYGYDCIVSIPKGLTFEKLEDLVPVIKNGMKCREVALDFVYESSSAYARIITEQCNDKEPYKFVKTEPYEVYCGHTIYNEPVISDMRYHPHILISGSTGGGKSVLIFTMLLNLMLNNSSDTQVFLAQVSAKKDLRIFRHYKHTKYYADSFELATRMYAYLIDEMYRRNNILNKYDDINTIYEYNKKFKKNKIPYIYVATDEFAMYMEDDLDDDKTANYKKQCLSSLARLAKEARSAGIYLITGLQRPDKENMPPIFKSLLTTRIAFAQTNIASSKVVIDDGEAIYLNHREAVILLGNKRHKIYTFYLDNNKIQELLSDYFVVNNENFVDISKYKTSINHSFDKIKTTSFNKKQQQSTKSNISNSNAISISGNKNQKGMKGVLD